MLHDNYMNFLNVDVVVVTSLLACCYMYFSFVGC